MGRLKILADGSSTQAKANARGHLFEKLMSAVLNRYGYTIDEQKPSVNYAGMEIDIEGRAALSGVKVYAECKCYDKGIDAPNLQAFFGKYMTKWLSDNLCQGLFIAIPGLNSHAKGFFNENCENRKEITVKLLNEEDVMDAIIYSKLIVSHDAVINSVHNYNFELGDWVILYTEKGFFWVQYIIPIGAGLPKAIILFDSNAHIINDPTTINYLVELDPEISNFELWKDVKANLPPEIPSFRDSEDQIVEVKGGSECFEYQFPASPQYFVGRKERLSEINSFVSKVVNKGATSRGILLEGNSGWGKSSLILASVESINKSGHYAVSIDSRSASSPQFVLKVVDYSLKKFGTFNGAISEALLSSKISGFDGAINKLLDVGKELEKKKKVLVIFFDQFENIFYLNEILKRIQDLYFRIQDSQSNIILGFSWKTDLIGSTSDFPYEIRDLIKNSSKRIPLQTFSESETSELLKKLENEFVPKRSLSKDLKFFLADFSQGYPWTLKKLCSHVKSQIEGGLSQQEISTSLLNIKDLFQDDLRGLSSEQEDTLKRIARIAPISVQELSNEDYKPTVVQSLVNARLLVKIASKYDIYWDIFRDFLNTGHVPIQENYLLRTSPGSIVRAIQVLNASSGNLKIKEFMKIEGLTKNSFYNLVRDIRLLGLATIDDKIISLIVAFPTDTIAFNNRLRSVIREKIQYNRLFKNIMDKLSVSGSLSLDEVSKLLSDSCPYILASNSTWNLYSNIILTWINFADLAIYDKKEKKVIMYVEGRDVRKQNLILPRRRGTNAFPSVLSSWIEKVAVALYEASKTGSSMFSISSEGFNKNQLQKAIATLEDFGFVQRKSRFIELNQKLTQFVEQPNLRPEIFAESALKIEPFKVFIDMLNERPNKNRSLMELYSDFEARMGTDWSEVTAKWYMKIFLNWARYSNLAPEAYKLKHKNDKKGIDDLQTKII
jgi:hypothetical protein